MESFQDIEHFVKTLSAAIKKKIPTKVSQLTNDVGYKTTDTNTTYKLSKTGSTVTLTGSDGSTTSVTDDNATYSSLKNPYSLTIQNNGNTVASYDGSTAKTANFTNATESANGLMSAADKSKIDGIGAGSNVKSVNSKTGAVTLTKSDIGLSNVDNTADSAKSVKYATSAGSANSVAWGNVSGRPSSLPANGGNSSTVNGHTVNADVPSGAKFTDTTYGIATSSTDGLMSKTDKAKLDGIDPSAITTNAANIKKNADEIAKLNSATGDSIGEATMNFTSSDVADGSATAWTSVPALASGEKHSAILGKVSQMFKNVRYLFKMLGTTDISGIGDGTATGAISALSADLVKQKDNVNSNTSTISTLNSNLAQYFFIENVSTFKPVFHYGVNCDRGTTTTITMDFGSYAFNDMSAIIFTRGALTGFYTHVDGNKKVYDCNISNILGNSNLTVTHSGSKVTLTVNGWNGWETFEMLFVMHVQVPPTFTVS